MLTHAPDKIRFGSVGCIVLMLAACVPDMNPGPVRQETFRPAMEAGSNLPPAQGEIIGDGAVRVALLVPLGNEGGLGNVGMSIRNGAILAIDRIRHSPEINSSIHLVVKDTGGNAARARAAAIEAVNEGASLVLGPLRSDAVVAAGSIARAAGIPLIGYSNNSSVAAPGVYLLNVLAESETLRSVRYVLSFGRKNYAAFVPDTDFGKAQERAFRLAAAQTGASIRDIYRFSSEAGARAAVENLLPLISSGQVDAVFLPDRATAPSIAIMLETAQIDKNDITIVGSADWDGDVKISQTPYLTGAFFPAVDGAGYERLRTEYETRFDSVPHPMVTFAYTSVLLANSSSLANTAPRYDRSQIASPAGFSGQDGVFRFLDNGTNRHSLVIKQVVIDDARVVDGAKMP